MRRCTPRVVLLLMLCSLLLMLFIQYPPSEWHSSSLEFNAYQKISDTGVKRKKLMLLWTTIFGRITGSLDDCPLKDQCTLTSDRRLVADADLLFFHMSGGDFNWSSIPKVRHSRQRYVFLLQEAPHAHYRINFDYIPGFFNWTMTYRLDSDIPMPYGGWWIRPEERDSVSPEAFSRLNLSYDPTTVLTHKTGLVLWLVSNCHTTSKRELIVEALTKEGIHVDVVGACSSNAAMRNLCPKSSDEFKCSNQLYSRYKFFIAFENAICKDYITEKYWDRWNTMAVPIVLRRHIYVSRIPAHSFIAVDDFANATELADYLRFLDGNDTAYMEYFKWRTKGYDRPKWNPPGYRLGYCRACENLLSDDGRQSIIMNMTHWFIDEAQCDKDEFAQSWVRVNANTNTNGSESCIINILIVLLNFSLIFSLSLAF